MLFSNFWWPLDLDDQEQACAERAASWLDVNSPTLDGRLVERSVAKISTLMAANAPRIVARDGLPHLCHAFVGWGNCVVEGRSLLSYIPAFLQRDDGVSARIPQCDTEGDFHPWQFFAYALMSGVTPATVVTGTNLTLEQIAACSIEIPTADSAELGHLLYAFSQFSPQAIPYVILDGQRCDREEVLRRAIKAHVEGHFKVCRKFHLTEGLCTATSLLPELAPYRKIAQGFLDGQMGMLLILTAILGGVHEPEMKTEPNSADVPPAVASLRQSMVIGEYFENHVYYAGHLIELAAIATMQGFTLSDRALWSVNYVLNTVSRLILDLGDDLAFSEAFLPLSHFRRGATMWLECNKGTIHSVTDYAALSRYVAHLVPPAIPYRHKSSPSNVLGSAYALVPDKEVMRPFFSEIVNAYAESAESGFEPRGDFHHFRRMGPHAWPRGLHFEYVDYGSSVGIELHIESDEALKWRAAVERVAVVSETAFPFAKVKFDPAWARNRGRAVIDLPTGTPAREYVDAMTHFVRIARPIIENHAT